VYAVSGSLTDRTTECTPSEIDHMADEEGMARPERFELPTTWFEALSAPNFVKFVSRDFCRGPMIHGLL